jgi:plasmid stability protein
MSQITLYLDDETQKQLRRRARRSGMSLSRWSAQVLKEKARSEWSEKTRALAGAWSDFPDQEKLRFTLGRDTAREEF